jgi:hypothetical protein
LFELYDKITSQERVVTETELDHGLHLATEADESGVAAFLKLQQYGREHEKGDLQRATELVQEALHAFAHLAEYDSEYRSRVELCEAILAGLPPGPVYSADIVEPGDLSKLSKSGSSSTSAQSADGANPPSSADLDPPSLHQAVKRERSDTSAESPSIADGALAALTAGALIGVGMLGSKALRAARRRRNVRKLKERLHDELEQLRSYEGTLTLSDDEQDQESLKEVRASHALLADAESLIDGSDDDLKRAFSLIQEANARRSRVQESVGSDALSTDETEGGQLGNTTAS